MSTVRDLAERPVSFKELRRGVQAPPSLAALVIFWSSWLRCRRAARVVAQAFVKVLACFCGEANQPTSIEHGTLDRLIGGIFYVEILD